MNKRPRILIIDDDGNWVQILRHFLGQAGYDVLSALSAEEGLEVAESELPDIIVCDIYMPRSNGYQFAHQLKSNPALRHILLVAMTGSTLVSTQTEAISVGFDAFIQKGISATEFVSQIGILFPA